MSTLFQMPAERRAATVRFRRPVFFGSVALVCGILSVLGALGHSLWGPFNPSPSFADQVRGHVTDVTDAVLSIFTGVTHAKSPPTEGSNLDSTVKQVVVLLSVVGMLTAMLAYVRRENRRIVGSALVISGVAFVTQYLVLPLLAVGVVVVLMLGAAIL